MPTIHGTRMPSFKHSSDITPEQELLLNLFERAGRDVVSSKVQLALEARRWFLRYGLELVPLLNGNPDVYRDWLRSLPPPTENKRRQPTRNHRGVLPGRTCYGCRYCVAEQIEGETRYTRRCQWGTPMALTHETVRKARYCRCDGEAWEGRE